MSKQSGNGGGSARPPGRVKKAYTAPVLVRWGTLRDMTLKVGHKGTLDGGRMVLQRRTR
jgi:hypothetical protein